MDSKQIGSWLKVLRQEGGPEKRLDGVSAADQQGKRRLEAKIGKVGSGQV